MVLMSLLDPRDHSRMHIQPFEGDAPSGFWSELNGGLNRFRQRRDRNLYCLIFAGGSDRAQVAAAASRSASLSLPPAKVPSLSTSATNCGASYRVGWRKRSETVRARTFLYSVNAFSRSLSSLASPSCFVLAAGRVV